MFVAVLLAYLLEVGWKAVSGRI